MVATVELVLKSYMPKHIEPGMWFITKLYQNTDKEYIEIWSPDKAPRETLEEFVTKHGAPVEPYLIYDEQVIAEPHEIGWWDDGPEYDELRDIELKDVNLVLNEWSGFVDIEVDEEDLMENEELNPILYGGKVTISLPGLNDEEEDWEDDEEWEDSDNDQNENHETD